jgi:hypothetical protein
MGVFDPDDGLMVIDRRFFIDDRQDGSVLQRFFGIS